MRTIALRLTKTWAAAPGDEILLDTNRYKETIRWTRVVGLVDHAQACLLRLFVRVAGTEILLKQEVQVAGLNSIQMESPVYLSGDYRIGFRVTGADAGENMEFSAFGIVEEPVTI